MSRFQKSPKTNVVVKTVETGDVDVNNLVPFLGLCCAFCSFYTDFPGCIGTVAETTLCCLSVKAVMCKPAVEDHSYCKCCYFDCDIDPMTSLCSSRSQLFCVDCRSALPNNQDVPCIISACFVTCCYNYGCKCKCCAKIEDMVAVVPNK